MAEKSPNNSAVFPIPFFHGEDKVQRQDVSPILSLAPTCFLPPSDRKGLTSALSPLDPPPPEHDTEDQDGDPLACCEQQHQDPGHIPACGRGTEGRGGIQGGCREGKTRGYGGRQ